jgi:hypothetical protein
MRIMGQVKVPQERQFYMLAAITGKWSSRELDRQIRTGAARRSEARGKKVSAALTRTYPAAADDFK